MTADARPHARLGGDFSFKPVTLVGSEPASITRTVGEEPEDGKPEQDRRNPFKHEEPLPTGQAPGPLEAIHDRPGNGIAKDSRDRDREHEAGHDAGALGRREPGRQVVDDPGEEACLRHAEKDPGAVVAPRTGDEGREHRHEPPGHHDPGDPGPGSEAPQEKIARHLEEEIADVEEAIAEIDDRIGEREVSGHLQPREADVRAVDDIEDIEQRQKRHEPPSDFRERALPDRRLVARRIHSASSAGSTGRKGGCHRFSPFFRLLFAAHRPSKAKEGKGWLPPFPSPFPFFLTPP